MIWFLASAAAAPLERSPRPSWVALHADLEHSPMPGGAARSSLQFLLVDDQLRMPEPAVEEAWYLHRSYRVVTHEGLDAAARFEVDYDPGYEQVLFHDVSVYRDGQWEDRLELATATELRRESELWMGLMDGLHTLTVLLPDVQVGDVVRYSYTLTGDDPVFEGHWSAVVDMAWGLPAERRILTVIGDEVPEPALHGAVPPPIRDEGQLSWDYGPVPAFELEAGAPVGASEGPWVELSTWQSWAEVVDWALPLYEHSGSTPELDALVLQLSQEADPLTAALTWVQDDVRYFGIELAEGSHVPRSPATVLKLRYGDCKDKTLLLSVLLDRLGIQSWPALVNSRGAPLDELQPGPGVFDHVILLVDVDGGIWVDPTYRMQGGRAGQRHVPDYKLALPVKDGQRGLIEMFPHGPPTLRRETRWSYELPELGEPRVDITEQAQREDADELRAWFSDSTPDDIAQALAQAYSDQAFLSPLREPTLRDDREASEATLVSSFSVLDGWVRLADGSESFSLLEPTVFSALPYPEPSRRSALALPEGLILLDRVEVSATDEVVFSEGEGRLVNRWFRFELRSEQGDGRLDETYELTVLKDRVEPDQLSAYRDQLDQLYGFGGVAAQRHRPATADGFLQGLALGTALGVMLSLGLASLGAAAVLVLKTRTVSRS